MPWQPRIIEGKKSKKRKFHWKMRGGKVRSTTFGTGAARRYAPLAVIALLLVVAFVRTYSQEGFDLSPPPRVSIGAPSSASGVIVRGLSPSNMDVESTTTREVTALDGDTVRYRGKKLRLLGVDTPEPSTYGNADCPEEARLGDRATNFTRNAVTGIEVEILWSGQTDKYGRDLVKIRVDGKLLSSMLIEAGLAEKWRGHQADWCRILGR